jgi:hypothetical protein
MGWFSDFVSNPIETISNTGQDIIDTTKDLGTSIDQTVRDTLPGGWTSAALAAIGAYYSPEIGAYVNADGSALGAAPTEAGASTLPDIVNAEQAVGTSPAFSIDGSPLSGADNIPAGGELTASQASDMIAQEQAGSMTAQDTLGKIAAEQSAAGALDPALATAAGTAATGAGTAANAGLGALTLKDLTTGAGLAKLLTASGGQSLASLLGGGTTSSATPWLQGGLALADLYQRQQASQALQDRFNQVNQQISGMYAPGSPEANLLQQEMERKDAAAGRNSQYGTRAVDLAAKMASIKGNLLAQTLGNQNNLLAGSLATGNSSLGSLSNLFGQNTALTNAANTAIGSGVNWGLNQLQDLFKNYGSTTGTDVTGG